MFIGRFTGIIRKMWSYKYLIIPYFAFGLKHSVFLSITQSLILGWKRQFNIILWLHSLTSKNLTDKSSLDLITHDKLLLIFPQWRGVISHFRGQATSKRWPVLCRKKSWISNIETQDQDGTSLDHALTYSVDFFLCIFEYHVIRKECISGYS